MVDDYTSGGGIMCSWLGNAAVLVINHNMIYSLMGGTDSCVGRGGLNHFCDLKTCKNRIFSKDIWSHLLILDSFSLSKGRIEVN
jgi:hypothetical protein